MLRPGSSFSLGLPIGVRAVEEDNSADHTSAKSHTFFKIAYHPAPLVSLIPKAVRKIGAEDAVQQIVKLLVLRALEFGDVDRNLLPDFRREFSAPVRGIPAIVIVHGMFPTRCAPLPKRAPSDTCNAERGNECALVYFDQGKALPAPGWERPQQNSAAPAAELSQAAARTLRSPVGSSVLECAHPPGMRA
jgi:hypothetical protein